MSPTVYRLSRFREVRRAAPDSTDCNVMRLEHSSGKHSNCADSRSIDATALQSYRQAKLGKQLRCELTTLGYGQVHKQLQVGLQTKAKQQRSKQASPGLR